MFIELDILDENNGGSVHSLFGSFLGGMKDIVVFWNWCLIFICDMAEGFYMLNFSNEEDVMQVLTRGPCLVEGKMLSLICWENYFSLSGTSFQLTLS